MCKLFAKLRKATIKFFMSVSVWPFVRMEQLRYHWMDFHEIWYLSIFRKYVDKIQVLFKYDKNNRYLTWRHMHIYDDISLSSSENEKYFIQNL